MRAPDQQFPRRATHWKLRTQTLRLTRRPLLMGILNITPDSFSDGGDFLSPNAAIERGFQLASEGADIIDIGGESTRPYSESISAGEELSRVMPVLQVLASQLQIPISIDTTKAMVAQEALAAGAEIINDISALESDALMLDAALEFGAGVCAMHAQGTPQNMQDNPTYTDVVIEVLEYLKTRRDKLVAAGVESSRLALDPGIGFGKTHQHNLTLMANCYRFHELGCPLLVGHSRKGFIGKVVGDKEADRLSGTIGGALSLAGQGVQILRVHDVRAVREALMLYEATGGIDGEPLTL